MKNLIITLIFTVFILQASYSQVVQQWVKTHNGTANAFDDAADITTDNLGNFYVTGTTQNSNPDIITIKYNSSGVQQWASVYNGPGNGSDAGAEVVVSSTGIIYTGGYATRNGTRDYVVIKYNSSGVQQWATFYNGPANGNEIMMSLAVDNNNNFYVTGESDGTLTDIATVKFNQAGAPVWTARYNSSYNQYESVLDMVIDNSGNVYVVGQSQVSGNNWNAITLKYNSSGVQQWASTYSGAFNGFDCTNAVAVDAAGNVYVTGSVQTAAGNFRDCFTIRYNTAGGMNWIQTYNGSANADDEGFCIQLDAASNVYVGGSANIAGQNLNYLLIKYNSTGTQQWTSTSYNGPGSHVDKVSSMKLDASGDIYVTGYSNNGTGMDYDDATVKYKASTGSQLWAIRYNGTGNSYDSPSTLILDNLGFIYITGSTTVNTNNTDFATIKYIQSAFTPSLWLPVNGATGIPLAPALSWNLSSNAASYRLQLSTDSNFTTTLINDSSLVSTVYNVGSGVLQGGTRYYWRVNAKNAAGTSAFTPTRNFTTTGMVGIYPVSSEIPGEFKLYNNYPNPFNPVTKIKFDIPAQTFTKLIVYDITGREVKALINDNLNAGRYEIDFNAAGLSSGAYFYRIEAGDYTDIKKMILVK